MLLSRNELTSSLTILLLASAACGDDGGAGGTDASVNRADAAISAADAALADATSTLPDAEVDPTDAAPTDPDAAPADDILTIVPSGYGVRTFTLDDTYVYFGGIGQGQGRIFRCPLSGCPAQPEVIVQTPGGLVTAMALVGDRLVYTTSRKVALVDTDGQNLEEIYEPIGSTTDVDPTLSVVGNRVWFGVTTVGASVVSRVGFFEADEPDPQPGFLTSADKDGGTGQVIVASSTHLAFWRELLGPGDRTIELLTFGQGYSTVATVPEMAYALGEGMLIAADTLFWIGNAGGTSDPYQLFACPLGDSCPDAAPIAEVGRGTLTADATHLYVPLVQPTGDDDFPFAFVVGRAPLAEVASGVWDPEILGLGDPPLFSLGTRRIRVSDTHVFSQGQQGEIVATPK